MLSAEQNIKNAFKMMQPGKKAAKKFNLDGRKLDKKVIKLPELRKNCIRYKTSRDAFFLIYIFEVRLNLCQSTIFM